jgi:hypothetical protein
MDGQGGITTWDYEGKVIESQWGKVLYSEWCKREAARFRRAGGGARVIRRVVQKDGSPRRECCVEGGPKQR